MAQQQDTEDSVLVEGMSWVMDLPERLRWLRKNARPRALLQGELGERLGRNQSYVSDAELGKRRRLSPEEVAEWAEACGFYGVLVFVPDEHAADDAPALLEDASPETLAMVLSLLRALPQMSPETRSTIELMLRSLSQQDQHRGE